MAAGIDHNLLAEVPAKFAQMCRGLCKRLCPYDSHDMVVYILEALLFLVDGFRLSAEGRHFRLLRSCGRMPAHDGHAQLEG